MTQIAPLPPTLTHRLERAERSRIRPRRPDEMDPHHGEDHSEQHEDGGEHDDGDHRRGHHGGERKNRRRHESDLRRFPTRTADFLDLARVPDQARLGAQSSSCSHWCGTT